MPPGLTDDELPLEGEQMVIAMVSLLIVANNGEQESKSAAREQPLERTQLCALATQPDPASDIPAPLLALFAQIDALGRAKVKGTRFVELEFSHPNHRDVTHEYAWVISQNADRVVVLIDDLIPWTYRRKASTTIPASWRPRSVRLTAIKDADFEARCKRVLARNQPARKRGRTRHSPPARVRQLMLAHAAWKNGLTKYCVPIVSLDPDYVADFDKYESAIREDLAWLHFLRGVNLLMFADRKEPIPYFRRVIELSPESAFARQSRDLRSRLVKMIKSAERPNDISAAPANDNQKAELLISRIKDLHCPQLSQPGFINPYGALISGTPDRNPPTLKLRNMGMKAVPALIRALEDDTPTRTVYHWRDFARSRVVWRVSDFSWWILRDITKRQFGNQNRVGFTLSSLQPEQKQQVITMIKEWYAQNKGLSDADRMLGSFSSPFPRDWLTAGEFFLKTKDKRAVRALGEKIPNAEPFTQGRLCELLSRFGDPSSKEIIRAVLADGPEHSDRLSAAIALWRLGDSSGVAVAIRYLKAKNQAYGSWEEPIWFLMRTRSKESIEALNSVVTKAPPNRAGEVLTVIVTSINGDRRPRRESAGCVEILPVLIAGMNRSDFTGATINSVKIRVKDLAAKAMVLLREGTTGPSIGPFVQIDSNLFDETGNEEERDAQIRSLMGWYRNHKDNLEWDSANDKLRVRK